MTEHLDPESDGERRPPFNPKLAVRLFNQGYDLDGFLARHGVRLSLAQREEFCLAAIEALFDAFDALEKRAAGDYRPDPAATRFPTWKPLTPHAETPALTFDGLVDAWLA